MKNITVTLWQDRPGGIELLIPDIIRSSNKQNFKVFILRREYSDLSVFKDLPIQIFYGSNYNLTLYFRYVKYVYKNRQDIFHLYNAGPIILLLLKIAKINKIIYSIHGTIYWKSRLQKLMRKLLWTLALDEKIIIIANSEWSKNRFLQSVSSKFLIKVIYNPINSSRFKNRPSNKIFPDKIIYVGRLARGKNLHSWINCANFILKRYPETIFVIYGEGEIKNTLENYVHNLGISDKINFYGYKKDIENAFKESDLLLFLSEYESFGNVVVESILSGTPVIVSDIPAMQEIFIHYPEFLVPLDESLNEKVLTKIINYPDLIKSTVIAANEFKEKFSMKNHITELENVYGRYE